MPGGKPAGVRCVNLALDNSCQIFGHLSRPQVCFSLKPSEEMCGSSAPEALERLDFLEKATLPLIKRAETGSPTR